MLDFWTDLPAWLRITSAALILIVGVLLFLFVSVRAGFILVGLGTAMILVGGKTDAEKNGYRF